MQIPSSPPKIYLQAENKCLHLFGSWGTVRNVEFADGVAHGYFLRKDKFRERLFLGSKFSDGERQRLLRYSKYRMPARANRSRLFLRDSV